MVIKSTNNNNAATVDVASLRNSMKEISPSTADALDASQKIDMIREYLSALNGETDAWAHFEPKLRRTIHPQVVIEATEQGELMHYDDLVALVRDKFIPNGCIAELLDINDNGDGTISVLINNHLPGEDGDVTRQRVYFHDDGRVVRVTSTRDFGEMLDRVSALDSSSPERDGAIVTEPCRRFVRVTDKPDFGAVLERASALESSSEKGVDTVAERYRRFLEAFDGSADAAERGLLFDELFDENFVFVTEDGEKNLGFFRLFVGSVVHAGQRPRIETVHVEAVGPNKIHVDFYVGKEDDREADAGIRVNRIVTVQDGKVIRSEPVSANDSAFTAVLNQVDIYHLI